MEEVTQFSLNALPLYGILHRPEKPAPTPFIVVMVVGGPQNRVGSHRSYVQIARTLCAKGLTVLRFDYEGLGDSPGEVIGYWYAGPSITAACAHARQLMPDAKKVFLWALCDGAAACMRLAGESEFPADGMVLANPYSHTTQSRAKAMLRHYYLAKITDLNFWKKLVRLELDFADAFTSLVRNLRRALGLEAKVTTTPKIASQVPTQTPRMGLRGPTSYDENTLPFLLESALGRNTHRIHFLLSEGDTTAQEWQAFLKSQKRLAPRLKNGIYNLHAIAEADHTFSKMEWKAQAAEISYHTLLQLWEATKDEP